MELQQMPLGAERQLRLQQNAVVLVNARTSSWPLTIWRFPTVSEHSGATTTLSSSALKMITICMRHALQLVAEVVRNSRSACRAEGETRDEAPLKNERKQIHCEQERQTLSANVKHDTILNSLMG